MDDFALLKGHTYATLSVDLEARRPIDVLPGREAAPVARWLADHPEVQIICRDRASAYAEAARTAAPQTVQFADAWHLWNNLAKAMEKAVTSHYGCLRTAHQATHQPGEPQHRRNRTACSTTAAGPAESSPPSANATALSGNSLPRAGPFAGSAVTWTSTTTPSADTPALPTSTSRW
ncbi:transposase [Kitasatospora paracochleata]|uniref:transposase n=1 Tax=Kitasatospora paracochleata TaxID=58354 RepID=UPI003898E619